MFEDYLLLGIGLICLGLCREDRRALFIILVIMAGNLAEYPTLFISISDVWYYIYLLIIIASQATVIMMWRPISTTATLNVIILAATALVIGFSAFDEETTKLLTDNNFVIILTSLNVLQYLIILGFSDGIRGNAPSRSKYYWVRNPD